MTSEEELQTEVQKMARKSPALRIRTQVVLDWAEHLATVSSVNPG